ncbi:unnamed protein product [Meloidogyne enterolobii]|uniref:Uncharacterized protein n=1 Tax=Meloidogyne enterolobii TaxID=390850 RepID=A0ACB1ACM7_MELEN
MHFGSLFSLPRGNSERFKPYSTSSPNRLKSVLHKSEWNDFQRRQQLKIPPKTEYLSIQEKMERLKKLIGLTTKDTSKTPTYAQFHFDSNGHSSSNNYPNLRTNNGTSLTGIVRAALFSKNNHFNSSPSVDLGFRPRNNSATSEPSIPPKNDKASLPDQVKPQIRPNNEAVTRRSISTPLPNTHHQWRSQRYIDEKENRLRAVKELEAELAERELSRHNRKINEQEMLRLRLQVEGLVLERREPPREEFPEIPNNVRQIIRIIWNKYAPPNEVFSNFDGVDIARKDLLTLCGAEWLNDEVINFYINLIVDRSKVNRKLPKVYAFNTYFYVNLSGKGFSSVKRWTKKVDIFENQMIFVPVHLGNHWCMAVIDFEERKIDYYDSLKADNFTCLELLSNYLAEESMDKRKRPYDMTGWEFTCRKDIPNQGNMWDCGMFSILFAEYASRRAPITFSQQHVPYFRERVVYEILRKELL